MDVIYDEIFRALGYLFIAGIVYSAGKVASDYSKNGKYKSVLWKGFLTCAGIALFASMILTEPYCEMYEDPFYGSGGCEYYADPTAEQISGNFAYLMTLLYIPVAIGALGNRGK